LSGAGRRRRQLGLVLIVALAAVVRLRGLASEGLWLDEAISVQWTRLDVAGVVRATAADVHPPLYAILLHGWVRALGDSDAAVRALSVVLGVAAVAVMAGVGARLWGADSGLAAALLLACSPYHVYYSQEARSYALLVLVALASWGRLLAARGSGRTDAGYVAATALLLYTHAYALFLLLAQDLYVLATRHRDPPEARRAWWRGQALLAVLYAPWAFVLTRQISSVQREYWIERPRPVSLLFAFVQYAGSLPVAAAMAVLVAAAIAEAVRGRSAAGGGTEVPPRPVLLAGLWLGLPHVVPYLLSQWITPFYLTRAAIGSLPALPLLAVAPLRRARPILAGTAVGILALLSLHALERGRAAGAREQWREAAAYLGRAAGPGDLIVIDAGYGRPGLAHYNRRPDVVVVPLPADLATDPGRAALGRALGGRPRVWIVRYQRRPDHEAMRRALGEGWRLVDYRAWRGLLLYRFDRAVTPAPPTPPRG
jgi:hypothetical protein